MTALVTDLVGVVSTCFSDQTAHLSLQSSPLQPRSFTEPKVNKKISFEPPISKPPEAAIKKKISSEQTNDRKEDNLNKERIKQQEYIHHLASYIDERAKFYNRTKTIPIHRPYPKGRLGQS